MSRTKSISTLISALLISFILFISIGSGNDLITKARDNDSGGEQTGHLFRIVNILDRNVIWVWAPTSKIITITTNFSSDPELRYSHLRLRDVYAIVLKNGRALVIPQLFHIYTDASFYSYDKNTDDYKQNSIYDNPYLKEIEFFFINKDDYFTREDIKNVILW